MIMRIYQVKPISFIPPKRYFGILTTHPLVGIFGSTYMLVFGAFLCLCPMLLKKPLWSFQVGKWTWGLITVGTFYFLVRWIYFSLRPALHALAGATCRF